MFTPIRHDAVHYAHRFSLLFFAVLVFVSCVDDKWLRRFFCYALAWDFLLLLGVMAGRIKSDLFLNARTGLVYMLAGLLLFHVVSTVKWKPFKAFRKTFCVKQSWFINAISLVLSACSRRNTGRSRQRI
jgi:hypothetical protein